MKVLISDNLPSREYAAAGTPLCKTVKAHAVRSLCLLINESQTASKTSNRNTEVDVSK